MTTSTNLAWKPVAVKSSEKRQISKFNCGNFFPIEDFVGSVGIMLLKFGLLPSLDIFETMGRSTLAENLFI